MTNGQLSVHDGHQCHCLMTMPDNYKQVLATQAEHYADISDILLTMDSYSNYAVRKLESLYSSLSDFR